MFDHTVNPRLLALENSLASCVAEVQGIIAKQARQADDIREIRKVINHEVRKRIVSDAVKDLSRVHPMMRAMDMTTPLEHLDAFAKVGLIDIIRRLRSVVTELNEDKAKLLAEKNARDEEQDARLRKYDVHIDTEPKVCRWTWIGKTSVNECGVFRRSCSETITVVGKDDLAGPYCDQCKKEVALSGVAGRSA